MDNGLKMAEKLIKKHKAKLDEVAEALLKTETIDKEKFEKLLAKSKMEKKFNARKSYFPVRQFQ